MKMNWLVFSVLGLFSLSIMSFLITLISRKGYSVSFILFFIASILTVGYFLQSFVFSHQLVKLDLNIVLILVAAGILSFFGNWLTYQAANDAPNPGLAVAIVGMQGVLVSILAYIFLKDKLNSLQIIGIILAVIAIFLINSGSSDKKSETINKEVNHLKEK